MKGITKDHETITKDYEILFCSMKDKCKKKNFALHLRPYVPIPQYWSGVSCICDIIAEFKLSCKIFHIYDTFQQIFRIYLRSYYFMLRHLLFFILTLFSIPEK